MKKYIDFTLVKIIATLYGFVVFITLIKKILTLIRKNVDFDKIDWVNFLFGRTFLDWFLITFYMIIVSIITKKMFSKNLTFKYIILVHIFLALFMTWFIFISAAIILLAFGTVNLTFIKEHILTLNHYIDFFDANLVVYLFMASVIYIYFYMQKLKDIEIQKSSLQNQLVSTKMEILNSQLHPHFLFNTLNSIFTLIEVAPKQAQNTLVDLSDLLRDILDLKQNSFILLSSEISLLKKYLNIMNVRFSNDLSVKLNIPNNVEDALVPTMLLQPIIENSIKHGYSPKIKKLKIVIDIVKLKNKLVIEISNTGKQIDTNSLRNGNGIKNIIKRLTTLYNGNYKFKFSNIKNSNIGVVTKISIPLKKNNKY